MIPEPNVQLVPYTLIVVAFANVNEEVRAEALKLPTFQLASNVIVLPALDWLMIAVSCGNGKLAAAGEPPDVVAHPVADQFWLPAKFQYTFFAAGNVMFEFPPQSPSRVPVRAVEVFVMRVKSTSEGDHVELNVRVAGPVRKYRLVGADPVHVIDVMVSEPETDIVAMPVPESVPNDNVTTYSTPPLALIDREPEGLVLVNAIVS